MGVQVADDEPVDDEQRGCADDPAEERVVVADDRVLHRVREQEQDDEIEGVELSHLALPGEAEADEEEDVNEDGAKKLFRDRDAGR